MKLTKEIIRNLIKEQINEALGSDEEEEKVSSIFATLSNLERSEVTSILNQVKMKLRDAERDAANRDDEMTEKLGKDATAGEYVDDFRKSKAPQFKGKSKKKKQQMAIAAYLDAQDDK